MKIIHSTGFSDHERYNYRTVVYENIFSAILILINATKTLNLKLSPTNEVYFSLSHPYSLVYVCVEECSKQQPGGFRKTTSRITNNR